ncbi:MAG: hypothetical protein IE931_05350 [Sphingobacteriales bacterium]|nr:hypothetical protein [Sphingobacteriales bacterium]
MDFKKIIFISLFAFSFVASCKKGGDSQTAGQEKIDSVNFEHAHYSGLDILIDSNLFKTNPEVFDLENTSLVEQSGVAASAINDTVLYVHQDNGNSPEVYVISKKGKNIGTIILNGVTNRDWEDIAVGPGPIENQSYIYVGNIGDNDSVYPDISIYRFPEPNLAAFSSTKTITITNFDKIRMKYPDGPKNAESLMVDPLTKAIFIASKESNISKIYELPYPQDITNLSKLKPLLTLPFAKLTAGDISSNGTEILLRSTGGVWLWKRNPEQSVAQALMSTPVMIPVQLGYQGEGITFCHSGSGFYTSSEVPKKGNIPPSIKLYQKK